MAKRFKKEKYLQMAKTEGVSSTLTQIMHELKDLEHQCFEGPGGFDAKLYEEMKQLRDLSREIWTLHHRYETQGKFKES